MTDGDGPGLTPAYGRVGSLARKLLEERDLSAVGPLLDALADEGRDDDRRRVSGLWRSLLANALHRCNGDVPTPASAWWNFSYAMHGILFLDLYEEGSVVRAASEAVEEALKAQAEWKAAADAERETRRARAAGLGALAPDASPMTTTGVTPVTIVPGLDMDTLPTADDIERIIAADPRRLYGHANDSPATSALRGLIADGIRRSYGPPVEPQEEKP